MNEELLDQLRSDLQSIPGAEEKVEDRFPVLAGQLESVEYLIGGEANGLYLANAATAETECWLTTPDRLVMVCSSSEHDLIVETWLLGGVTETRISVSQGNTKGLSGGDSNTWTENTVLEIDVVFMDAKAQTLSAHGYRSPKLVEFLQDHVLAEEVEKREDP